MKKTFNVLLLVGLLYMLPAGIILKYGDRNTSMVTFVPVLNVIISTFIVGQNTWKYIHER